MNSYLSRCALTTKYMSKAGDQSVCSILVYFFRLIIITSLFAFNSTGGHAYIACNGVEREKKSLFTSGTFHKICEGKSPINCLCVLLLCSLGLLLIIQSFNPNYCITLFIRLVRDSRMRLQG